MIIFPAITNRSSDKQTGWLHNCFFPTAIEWVIFCAEMQAHAKHTHSYTHTHAHTRKRMYTYTHLEPTNDTHFLSLQSTHARTHAQHNTLFFTINKDRTTGKENIFLLLSEERKSIIWLEDIFRTKSPKSLLFKHLIWSMTCTTFSAAHLNGEGRTGEKRNRITWFLSCLLFLLGDIGCEGREGPQTNTMKFLGK